MDIATVACQHMMLYVFILLYVNKSTCVFLPSHTLFESLFCSSLFVLCPLGVASVVVCLHDMSFCGSNG